MEPSTADAWLGLVVGGMISIAGIAIAYLLYVRRPGDHAALAERLPRLHGFLCNKWYFDELIDALVVRPDRSRSAGSPTRSSSASSCRGSSSAATDGVVAAPASVVRGAQSGYRARLRAVAGRRLRRPGPLLPGAEHERASMLIRCCSGSARGRADRAAPAGRLARWVAVARARGRRSSWRSSLVADFEPAPAGCSTSSTRPGSRAGRPLPARRGRDEPVPGPAHRRALVRRRRSGRRCASGIGPRLFFLWFGLAETAVARRVPRPGPGRCSSSSST